MGRKGRPVTKVLKSGVPRRVPSRVEQEGVVARSGVVSVGLEVEVGSTTNVK